MTATGGSFGRLPLSDDRYSRESSTADALVVRKAGVRPIEVDAKPVKDAKASAEIFAADLCLPRVDKSIPTLLLNHSLPLLATGSPGGS